jgi:hypothetical protein
MLFAHELGRPGYTPVRREQTQQAHGRGRLAGTGLTYDGQYLTRVYLVSEVLNYWDPLAVNPELNLEPLYIEDRFALGHAVSLFVCVKMKE